MRFSNSIRKNVFETVVGGLTNKLHLHKRRDTLFFEDIGANYIKEAEKAGYEKQMEDLGQKWMNLVFVTLMPSMLKKMPSMLLLNNIMKSVWINLGLIDDLNFIKKDDTLELRTRNEGLTRIIEKNRFVIGFYKGILNVLFNSEIECISAEQTKESSAYFFKIKNAYQNPINSKDKETYDKLNYLSPEKGFTLKDALNSRTLILTENNIIQFRNKNLVSTENTLIHLFGNEKILLEKVPEISYNYFKEIIKESDGKEKLTLLKTLLQTMGWGVVTIISEEDNITVEIKNPPYGLQAEKDDWSFFINVILGYLWLINNKFKIKDVKEKYKDIVAIYSTH